MTKPLSGVIAAVATPVTPQFEPDVDAFVALARDLLEHGCDALNVLGTTGESTSFSLAQRLAVMRAAASALDRGRLMVGTGAAALDDAIALTRAAGDLGFAGALLLPPFYYKGIGIEGVAAYVSAVVEATAQTRIPLYLYHYPALSGVPYTPDIVAHLLRVHPDRIVGLKDSSGDMPYARTLAAAHPDFAVFPSNEASLMEARSGVFAGCISATCNLNADLCSRALRSGDADALESAVRIRKLFDGKALVAGVKAGLAALRGEPGLARVLPPLTAWTREDREQLADGLAEIRRAHPESRLHAVDASAGSKL